MTPKMDMVYYPSSIVCTYTGPLDFLDDQQRFSNIFRHNPVMLLVIARSSRAIEDSENLHSKLLDLCSLSHLPIFATLSSYNTLGPQFMIQTRWCRIFHFLF